MSLYQYPQPPSKFLKFRTVSHCIKSLYSKYLDLNVKFVRHNLYTRLKVDTGVTHYYHIKTSKVFSRYQKTGTELK